MTEQVLDATGLKCPLPVLRARRTLKAMPSGAVLEVHADDAAAPGDFESFCRTTGDALEESREEGGRFVFRIRKA